MALLVALLLVALGTWGYLDPLGLVVVDRLLDHVFWFGVLAALLGGVGLALLTPRPWLRVVVLTLAVTVAFVWSGVGALYGRFVADGDTVAVVAAPRADHEVRVAEGNGFDPSWEVYVRQTRGLASREWYVGCLDGDDPAGTFRHVEWRRGQQPVLVLAGREVPLRLDPATGEPADDDDPALRC